MSVDVGGGRIQWYAFLNIPPGGVPDECSKGKGAIGKATGVDELILYDEAPGTAYEDYESVDGLAEVMKITDGVGCKAVIDGIGKATLDMSLGSLAQRGIFVSFGNASGAVPAYPPLRHIAKSSFMCRPKLLDYTRNREELLYRSNEIMGWLQSGQLKVSVDTSFPLDQAAEGHKYLESGASTGKVKWDNPAYPEAELPIAQIEPARSGRRSSR